MNHKDAAELEKALKSDPAVFRQYLVIDADGTLRKLSKALDDWQAEDFHAVDPSLCRVVNPGNKQFENAISRHWWERPRGHSKTTDIAVAVIWLLFASQRKIKGVVGSGDKDQAKLVRDAVDSLLRLNPWLAQILTVQATKIVNTKTGSEVEILSSDAASSYGHLTDFVVLDEITHWNSRDLFDSLFSATAKRKHCLLLVISNAGFRDTWQWELRENIRTDPNWRFSRLDGPQASWQSEAALAEQRRLLPAKVYARLWLNQWSDGSGDALDADLIQSAIRQTRAPSRAEPGWVYVAGLDIGIRHDASALVVIGKHVGYSEPITKPKRVFPASIRSMIDLGLMEAPHEETEYKHHPGTGMLKLAAVRVWTPGKGSIIQFHEIEHEISRLHDLFPLSRLAADPFQAEQLLQRLHYQQGINAVATPFTGLNLQSMAQVTLDSFREKQIELYPHDQLVADLKAMKIVEKSYGWRLVPGSSQDGTPHGDASTALALALHASKEIISELVFTSDRQLVFF
jgi:phage terminase large subunit-like protein